MPIKVRSRIPEKSTFWTEMLDAKPRIWTPRSRDVRCQTPKIRGIKGSVRVCITFGPPPEAAASFFGGWIPEIPENDQNFGQMLHLFPRIWRFLNPRK